MVYLTLNTPQKTHKFYSGNLKMIKYIRFENRGCQFAPLHLKMRSPVNHITFENWVASVYLSKVHLYSFWKVQINSNIMQTRKDSIYQLFQIKCHCMLSITFCYNNSLQSCIEYMYFSFSSRTILYGFSYRPISRLIYCLKLCQHYFSYSLPVGLINTKLVWHSWA